jgi:AraC-like DNA-binding protein
MRKVTLEETQHMCFEPSLFQRIFKEEMGENFNSYVISSELRPLRNAAE